MNRLKEIRNNAVHNGHKMRQADLAELLGVTKLTVSNWENGKHEIKADKANEIAKLFNVSVSYLLGYSDKKEPYYNDEMVAVAFLLLALNVIMTYKKSTISKLEKILLISCVHMILLLVTMK